MMRLRGFTLVEMLITVVIVAILASVALPLSDVAVQRSREQDLRHALREIREALDAYKRAGDEGRILRAPDQSGYPPTLSVLVYGATDVKSPNSAKIYFLRRVPRDPLNPALDTQAEATWGTRSYESPPGNPRSGKDVFDVYSLNGGTGLNGIPYKQW
ncbi:MAG: type II secretion system protein [Actinomycetota bacterium]